MWIIFHHVRNFGHDPKTHKFKTTSMLTGLYFNMLLFGQFSKTYFENVSIEKNYYHFQSESFNLTNCSLQCVLSYNRYIDLKNFSFEKVVD